MQKYLLALVLLVIGICYGFEADKEFYLSRYKHLADISCNISIPQLYYVDDIKSAPHLALERVRDINADEALINYYKESKVDRDKWNILVIMIARVGTNNVSDKSDELLGLCIEGLKSKDDWLRTESVFGLGYVGSAEHIQQLMAMRNDPCESVLDEIERAIDSINERIDIPIQ